ncbi:MAG: hypothetical protein GX606_01805 [Elusimicrobia bacterium]|nr:hypothetical protein [Elusimicrobiota bacterium]
MPESAVDLIHRDVLERFRRLLDKGRLAHAYLFSGPQGTGKFETACAVARLVNCPDKGGADCDCASCRKMRGGHHPDLFIVEKLEDKSEIMIGQFCERANNPFTPVIPRLTLRPFEAVRKVCIIRDAHLMSAEAANAFLKTLEEPPEATVIILTTAVPARLLKTIVSRCHEVRFFAWGEKALASRLQNEYDVASLPAGIMARFHQGAWGPAAAGRKDFFERKNAFIDQVLGGPMKDPPADKEEVRECCQVLFSLFRDVSLHHAGAAAEQFVHQDRIPLIQDLARRHGPQSVGMIIAQIARVREAVDQNFNVKIAFLVLKEMI